MKNKEETIKYAYGHHWDKVKDFVDQNGFFNCRQRKLIEVDLLMKDFNKNEISQRYINEQLETYIRPKSLKGIENNNGWIKTIDNIPDDDIDCFFISNNLMYNGLFDIVLKQFCHGRVIVEDVTHYIPIIPPFIPLY